MFVSDKIIYGIGNNKAKGLGDVSNSVGVFYYVCVGSGQAWSNGIKKHDTI